MVASAGGRERYVARHLAFRAAGSCRADLDLQVSSLGIGTYLGSNDDPADCDSTDAPVPPLSREAYQGLYRQ